VKATNVRPITELKHRTKALIREVTEGGQSMVITQNGKPQVVVMDAMEHARLLDTLTMLKLLAQSVGSLEKAGGAVSSAEVRLRAKAALAKATLAKSRRR
jgi:prevent-host-death family protein